MGLQGFDDWQQSSVLLDLDLVVFENVESGSDHLLGFEPVSQHVLEVKQQRKALFLVQKLEGVF